MQNNTMTSIDDQAIAPQAYTEDNDVRVIDEHPTAYLCLLLLPFLTYLILRTKKREILQVGSLLINVSKTD